MNVFKTPQEAIAACDAECERAWNEFVKTHNFTPNNPDAFNTMKLVFRSGYMSGATFISSHIVNALHRHAQTSIIEPGA